jgi:hypothetical protein
MEIEDNTWPEVGDPVNIFRFFEECPDIIAPKNMQDMPRYIQALSNAGWVGWAGFFSDWYAELCSRIEEEVTISA